MDSAEGLAELQRLYEKNLAHANAQLAEVRALLERVMEEAHLVPLFPIEQRVKSWESLKGKVGRRGTSFERVSAIEDLAGIRVIFAYDREVLNAAKMIEQSFSVRRGYDAKAKLGEDQFGYASVHYIVKPPGGFRRDSRGLPLINPVFVEIQVRTAAQHLWAAVSHQLQYKREDAVPPPIRRALHRTAALLELVDLEIERVLAGRDAYLARPRDSELDEPLNVDSLTQALDDLLPAANKADKGESYSELLEDLTAMDVRNKASLQAIISRYGPGVLAEEARFVEIMRQNPRGSISLQGEARFSRGVVLTHAGLLRSILGMAFDKRWQEWLARKKKDESHDPGA